MRFNLLWRFLAFLALLLYAALVFLIVKFALHNLGYTLLFCVTATFVVYSLWKVLTSYGSWARSALLLLGLGIAGLIVELIYFFRTVSSLRTLASFAILTIIYVGYIDILRKRYWDEARKYAELTHKTAHFEKPFLIINPKSGDGRAIKAHVDELATKQGIKVIILKKEDNVETVAQQAVMAGADVLGVSGGDGSIGAVAKVAIENDLPIVVLPGGTRCHFARDIGLDPKRIADALKGFEGVERRIDVGNINGRIFLNNVSFGLYADIIDNPNYRENKFDVSRKALQSIVSGAKKPYDLQFRHGREMIRKAVQVLVGVNSYQTLNVFELGRREKLDEGVLQVTEISKLNDETMSGLIKSVSINKLLSHTDTSVFDQWKTKVFSLTNKRGSIVAGVDGEREEYKTPVTIDILPKALSIFVPAEGVRNRPKHAFSWLMVRRLWNSAAH